MAAISDLSSSVKSAINNILKDFLHVEHLREEQEDCITNLVNGKDDFAILPTRFGKSSIFQLLPRVMSSMNEKDDAFSKIIMVSPLVAIMKDQVEQLNKIGVSATAIGIDEVDMDKEAAKNGKCKIVYRSPETWLSKVWRKELQGAQLGMQTVAIAIDEVHSVTEW
ncbi:ATP-dependent DNA helicase RecQ-like [Montipora foliosa]|uniref:ATP-dependent DNA helicase RecQ-like n=1 Tax=Montipora foliosa TaxID=591990 RepID=UPI0035F1BDF3